MFAIIESEHYTEDAENIDTAEENDDIMEKMIKLNGKGLDNQFISHCFVAHFQSSPYNRIYVYH